MKPAADIDAIIKERAARVSLFSLIGTAKTARRGAELHRPATIGGS